MRILLCLPTRQHIPNLLHVHHFRPDVVLLLDSPTHQGSAERMREVLKLGRIAPLPKLESVRLQDEDTLAEIRGVIRAEIDKRAGADWIANLTGGTKPEAIAAYECFREIQATMTYVHASRPNTIVFLADDHEEQCDYQPGLREFAAAYGFRVPTRQKKLEDAEAWARGLAPVAREIARHATGEELLGLNEQQRGLMRRGRLTLKPEHRGRLLARGELLDLLAQALDLQVRDGGLCGRPDKRAGDFLSGGWLEVFFYNLLSQHQDALGLWDVHLSVYLAAPNQVQNELDVAFVHNYELHMVECKSGTQEHDPAGEILYKIEAVMSQLHATLVRKHLVTTAPSLVDAETGAVKQAVQNRASLYDCRIVTARNIRHLAECADDADAVREVFGLV
jgi:hypothetical protein